MIILRRMNPLLPFVLGAIASDSSFILVPSVQAFVPTAIMKRHAQTKSRSAAILARGVKRAAPMSGKIAPTLEKDRVKDDSSITSALLAMLSRMTEYFFSMVDPETSRFYYRCLPEDGARVHGHCPIRDLGSAWDTATLLRFWRTHPAETKLVSSSAADRGQTWMSIDRQLSEAVTTTIGSYAGENQLIRFDAGPDRQRAALSTTFLQEPSNIAHSAFLILATTGALRLSLIEPSDYQVVLNDLANGILSMEHNESGAFAIHFGSSDTYSGIEFYPGEALLSLLDVYQYSVADSKLGDSNAFLSFPTIGVIIPAAVRAFHFYSNYYRQGNVDEHYTSFFGNWQVQCFTRLFEILRRKERAEVTNRIGAETSPSELAQTVTSRDVAEYVFELCDSITRSRSWKQLMKRNYKSLATVEIACGLEALADGSMIALASNRNKVAVYKPFIEAAVEFLGNVQDQVPHHAVGSGGLGHAILVTEQRLDVTGHAVNALVKVVDLYQVLHEEDGDEN